MVEESDFEGNPVNSGLLEYAAKRGFGDLHMKVDQETGLVAVIALHSTKLGPALGGCRFLPYPNSNDAIYDAMRLARGMTYKAAVSQLPLGGGKAVVIKPKEIKDRHAYFRAFAEFVNELGGRYITAIDSGTTLADMDIIHQYTPYVASVSEMNGEPSPATSKGVFRGIEAAVKVKLKKDSVKDLHVAIQGVGKVGYGLAKRLHDSGARLTVTDVKQENIERCQNDFNANVVGVDDIHKVECDIFAPCALGAILNEDSILELKTSIVAGAANNQLARPVHGSLLHARNILYAPDYVINAGGLIYAYSKYESDEKFDPDAKIDGIHHTLLEIFERSIKENQATSVIAELIATERLAQ